LTSAWKLTFGARPVGPEAVQFRVWAPKAKQAAVRIRGAGARVVPLQRAARGVFELAVPNVGPGCDYLYVLDDRNEYPDPCSRWQPLGSDGPSRIIDPNGFLWDDADWCGVPLDGYIIYELHVATFTPEGTFAAARARIPYLKELGVTAIELMPVAEFPGTRNWGYDGVNLYAPHSTYGGPDELKRLVADCHRAGLAIMLDVVYNHLGPEGPTLAVYSDCFSENYLTPWGQALNFDGPDSEGVRRFFIDNALYWLTEYHIDALRLDATNRMYDLGPHHVLAELSERWHEQARLLGRSAWLIAESDLNDVRVISPVTEGGQGMDAQWSDDFHHAVHGVVTGSRRGYLADFGRPHDLCKALVEGFVYDGRFSEYRRRRHGTSSRARPGKQFVVFIQNHDQIANTYWGGRLSSLVGLEQQKLAATLLLTAPNVPLLFMGQEYGEPAPFLYFVNHGDPALVEQVRTGRLREYAPFVDEARIVDPQSPEAFAASKLNWDLPADEPHACLLAYYRALLALRRQHECLGRCEKDRTTAICHQNPDWLVMERAAGSGGRALIVCNFEPVALEIPVNSDGQDWEIALWSGAVEFGGKHDCDPPVLPREGPAGGPTSVRLGAWSTAIFLQEESKGQLL
jgi:maltooligosyltrehalose trehalohydrolase